MYYEGISLSDSRIIRVKELVYNTSYMNAYTSLKKCPGCNGPVFKFVNVSTDTFHVECGYTSLNINDVTVNKVTYKNICTPSKKLPCGFKQNITDNMINVISAYTPDDEDVEFVSDTKKLHTDFILGNEDNYIQSYDDDDDEQEEGYALDDADDENDDVDESEEEDEPLDD